MITWNWWSPSTSTSNQEVIHPCTSQAQAAITLEFFSPLSLHCPRLSMLNSWVLLHHGTPLPKRSAIPALPKPRVTLKFLSTMVTILMLKTGSLFFFDKYASGHWHIPRIICNPFRDEKSFLCKSKWDVCFWILSVKPNTWNSTDPLFSYFLLVINGFFQIKKRVFHFSILLIRKVNASFSSRYKMVSSYSYFYKNGRYKENDFFVLLWRCTYDNCLIFASL